MKDLKILVPVINEKELYFFKKYVADKNLAADNSYVYVSNNEGFKHPDIQIYNKQNQDNKFLHILTVLLSEELDNLDCEYICLQGAKTKVALMKDFQLEKDKIYFQNANYFFVKKLVAEDQFCKKIHETFKCESPDFGYIATFIIFHKSLLNELRRRIIHCISVVNKMVAEENCYQHITWKIKHMMYFYVFDRMLRDLSAKKNLTCIDARKFFKIDSDYSTRISEIFYKNELVTAIIPARGGSRRLKDKNIVPFNGTTLLENKIEQLKRSKLIDNIVVSSDSDEYLALARKHKVMTHKRAAEYSDEQSKTFGEVVSHICSNVPGKYIVWATCTCPFIDTEDFDMALREFANVNYEYKRTHSSLLTFEEVRRYVWNNDGPLNYQLGLKHIPSQQLDPIYIPTFGIAIAAREDMIKWNYLHDSNPYKYIVDKKKAIDIDDELDYNVALALCK